MPLDTEHLRDILNDNEALLDLALEQLFPDPDAPMSLDALRVFVNEERDLASLVLEVLQTSDKARSFETFLKARGITLLDRPPSESWDLDPIPFAGVNIPEPEKTDFDFARLAQFAPRAEAFRCQICVAGTAIGSGAFISKQLVLTAAHVLDDLLLALDATVEEAAPTLSIRASDGASFPARLVWHSPVHDSERQGAMPPEEARDTHQDIALLKVGLPIGDTYGFAEIPDPPVDWTGSRLMTLVHYPGMQSRGFTSGFVLRKSEEDLRLLNDMDTAPGSSGGPAFDHDLRFIGVHQGRFEQFRRLVPHSLFAESPGFRDTLQKDRVRRYLWSLDDNIDGPIIVGRKNFFEGLSKMLDEPASMLRGIWVRRLNTSSTTGLNFSFSMLRAFLRRRRLPSDPVSAHRCFRIPTDIEEQDLIATLAREVLGDGDVVAHPGVRGGETSDVAFQRDRAMALARRLQERAAGQGATFWIFFEPPPDDRLSDIVRAQFEHLGEWLVTHRNLRIVIAGFERIGLAPLRFQNITEVNGAHRPGLLVDPLGTFERRDIAVTLGEALADAVPEDAFDPTDLDRMVSKVLKGMEEITRDHFAFADIALAIERIRKRVKLEAGLD